MANAMVALDQIEQYPISYYSNTAMTGKRWESGGIFAYGRLRHNIFPIFDIITRTSWKRENQLEPPEKAPSAIDRHPTE
jgi:hypothetical protein